MNEEGEFKKRIATWYYDEIHGTANWDDLEKIMDVARKDINQGFPKGKIVTNTTEETRLLVYILDLRARFLKWFGEEKK
jgi:hypothetical protein